jgi:tetratricopeptide (TPR) repeat protein
MRRLLALLFLLSPLAAAAIDLDSLWDFSKPELSEQRLRAALAGASADDTLILQTQIARTHGLRGDFAKAGATLDAIEPRIAAAGVPARVHFALERGRTLASATHKPESQTPQTRDAARAAYRQAIDLARAGGLDELAVDALHMMAFVDTAPAEQLKWGREALAVVTASTQPKAKQWEASLRNNIGVSLHELGRFDEALAEFERALVLREARGKATATREARWMVGWTLRALKRNDEALALQLRLERECAEAKEPDPYVFEELELLYRLKGDEVRAKDYAARRKALGS